MTETRITSSMLFDRSDPDELVAYFPVNHPKRIGDGNVTRLDDLRTGGFMPRTDVALVNLEIVITRQVAAYFDEEGKPFGEAMEHLTPEQITELEELGRKMLATAEAHPEFKVYLR